MNEYYLASTADLNEAVESWRRCAAVGLDTEFIRTRTFYPIPALYQVATPDAAYLIDPLAVDDWTAFAGFLADPDTTKVVHACSEDLEVFARHFDLTPEGLFDTQVAVAFLHSDYSPSYATLVERYCGTRIDKAATRSDWLARPLSAGQLHYAAEDVTHLLELHESLLSGLSRSGRTAWFEDENRIRTGITPVAPELYFRSLKKAWRYSRRQLARLRSLCLWREQRARKRDLPRQRVVRDEHLIALAEPEELDREAVFDQLPGAVANRFWRDLVEAAEAGNAAPESMLPERLDPPLSQSESELVKRLRAHGSSVAGELGMAEELLSRRREVEACLRCYQRHGQLSDAYRGWRHALVGTEFESVLAQSASPPSARQ